jgi:hypothetical protein
MFSIDLVPQALYSVQALPKNESHGDQMGIEL